MKAVVVPAVVVTYLLGALAGAALAAGICLTATAAWKGAPALIFIGAALLTIWLAIIAIQGSSR